MTSEEISIFAKEVYKQCIDKKMTYDEFNLFVHYMTMHKEAVNSALRRHIEKLIMPTLESID